MLCEVTGMCFFNAPVYQLAYACGVAYTQLAIASSLLALLLGTSKDVVVIPRLPKRKLLLVKRKNGENYCNILK